MKERGKTKSEKVRMPLLIASSLLLFTSSAAPALPYGTYVVRGALKDDYNTVLRDGVAAKMRLQRADGAVIAESRVSSANDEGVSFLLEVPVASASTESTCAVGETLDCALVTKEEGTIVVPSAVRVGSPLKPGSLSVNCTKVRSYTNPKDGMAVEIPEAYIAEAESFLPEGEAYDPWKDYDGDGVSNYSEFLAGTIPFDESDVLRVRKFGPKDGKLALTFEHVGGHVYAVSSANTLAKPEWARKRVRKSASGAELDQVLAEDAAGEPGLTEIFITPLGDASGEFFKLEAK